MLAVGYVLLTPRFVPDLVSVPAEMSGLPAGVAVARGPGHRRVAVPIMIRLAQWALSRRTLT
jgi:hypothetical protein